MITRDLREAIGRAVASEESRAVAGERRGSTSAAPDPGLRPGRKPGQYSSSVAFSLSAVDVPERVAERIAGRLNEAEPWIETAEVTGRGFVTVTVTPEALRGVAERMADAGPDCARSNALRGDALKGGTRGDALKGRRSLEVPAGDWESAASWEEARLLVVAEATARLAEAAGAEMAGARAAQPAETTRAAQEARDAGADEAAASAGAASVDAAGVKGVGSPGGGGGTEVRWEEKGVGVPETVAFAGRDAVRFFLLRAVPGSKISVDQRKMARHLPGNPAYAVRYAHARAASGVRWAAVADPVQAVPQRPSADPGEPALLDALSWLPERVATAARRGRPDEFARYLERVAEVTLDTLTRPPGGRAPGSDRLALAKAARTGLAAGLELLGVNAPERLLPNRPEKIKP